MRHGKVLWPGLMAVLVLACRAGAAEVRFEAEDVLVNREALIPEKSAPDKWTLWSTDVNAQAWSGRVVVRAPAVQADRERPEDGAPPLLVRLPIPEAGVYTISLRGGNRPLGLSVDGGQTWRRFGQGIIVRAATLPAGPFECWFDDRYAAEEPRERGSGYLDYFLVDRLEHIRDNLANPDFEAGEPGQVPVGWIWWHRDQLGEGVVTPEAHGGRAALRIKTPEGRDWALTNTYSIAVQPGEYYLLTGWGKTVSGVKAVVSVVGKKNGAVANWAIARANARGQDWRQFRTQVRIADGIDEIHVRVTGGGACEALLDDLALTRIEAPVVPPPPPPIEGFAHERVIEPMGRGVVAQTVPDGVYVSWRLLRDDPAEIAFDVFRRLDGQEQKLNAAPIRQTCDFLDQDPAGATAVYLVRPAPGVVAAAGETRVWTAPDAATQPYQSFALSDPEHRVQKIGIGDLNGDGVYDYVVKHPMENVDPWEVVWYKSPDTYKLEAFLSDGTRLWTRDLGWAIERGMWYSPYIVYDFNGDGKAEVAVKMGEGDPRGEDGRVTSGPEWLVILDGMTGADIARAPWPSREPFENYNLSCRNLLIVAYLDGRTPCVVALRGTYGAQLGEAWQLKNGSLERLWSYDNEQFAGCWGQGAHTNYALDVDGDGRDEIVLGSAVLDDTGVPLWTTGKGHPDGVFVGDLQPWRPGLEVAYVMEARQAEGGLCMADAATGKLLWKLGAPTSHVDGKGTCADLDPRYPGAELAGADMRILEPGTNKRGLHNAWLFTAAGELLYEGPDMPYRFGIWTAYWDADLQKELCRGKMMDPDGGEVGGQYQGSLLLVADALGDWREEIFTTSNGEFRIYSTPLPAMDRRVCLMQEHNYRLRMASNAMGYVTEALLPYDPEAEAPNLNLTFQGQDTAPSLQVVAVASRRQAVQGRVVLTGEAGVRLTPASFAVELPAGERLVQKVALDLPDGYRGLVRAQFEAGGGVVLRGQAPVRGQKKAMTEGLFVEAESFAGQEGGSVQVRDDKPGTRGQSISHWDAAGHRLTWQVKVPEAGRYRLQVRYCNPAGARRALVVSGREYGPFTLPGTGGFGQTSLEWEHAGPAGADGQPLTFELAAGTHAIVMENIDGKGCNLDYLVLEKEK